MELVVDMVSPATSAMPSFNRKLGRIFTALVEGVCASGSERASFRQVV